MRVDRAEIKKQVSFESTTGGDVNSLFVRSSGFTSSSVTEKIEDFNWGLIYKDENGSETFLHTVENNFSLWEHRYYDRNDATPITEIYQTITAQDDSISAIIPPKVYKLDYDVNSSTSTTTVSTIVTNVGKPYRLYGRIYGVNFYGDGSEIYNGGRSGALVKFNLNDSSEKILEYHTNETATKQGKLKWIYSDGSVVDADYIYYLDDGSNVGAWATLDRDLRSDFNTQFTSNDFDTDVDSIDLALGGGATTSQVASHTIFTVYLDDIRVYFD